ncbi:endonuclease III domain-containing protein [Ectothiorhodospira sp. BSL-9]|uniref:endonuclease III domain-containing protein n=1 Tax=Ectothiorhodospira sp. BSL-9 TaxID=1442136 RepID=UPI0007B45B86|nr:endonuclease III domain-containing protein [Ectothiorhodospira sp. BSL-9]ANB03411.1 endonuclease [Ectothiorhodospira sp. BSL-9]TVQ72704.1 MAG: endonuclease III domain-containing protein [Chromatiaceae bacterium]
MNAQRLKQVFDRLSEHHGPLDWWPGDSGFEVMVGAILTQNTAWSNVEQAIANLKRAEVLTPERILALPPEELGVLIRPSGYFNVKSKRLRSFCQWYLEQGGEAVLSAWNTGMLRTKLLSVNGVGPETADDILLYAFERPVFVVDAYTRRLFSRLGMADGDEPYESLRASVEAVIGDDVPMLNELHAVIVIHGKDVCRPRPRCNDCVLLEECPTGQGLNRFPPAPTRSP